MRIIDDGVAAAIIINLIIIITTIQCVIASRRTEHFESLFPNSPYIKKNKVIYERAGLIGKLIRTGTISTVLAIPSIFTKKNLVARNEIENFPKRTKLLLVTLWVLHITLFSALVLSNYL